VTVVSGVNEASKDLAPNGVLRAAINLGNPCFAATRESFEAMARGDADICFLAVASWPSSQPGRPSS